jgi:hypothetical protein
MALSFVVGAIIASAATAGAASLITGRQIKDGSIAAKDLTKAARKQFTKPGRAGATGREGPAGPQGAAGSQGPAGPVLTVKDSAGAAVGTMVGRDAVSFDVLRDGGFYRYTTAGSLLPAGQLFFKVDTCLGTPYTIANFGYGTPAQIAQTFGGAFRVVFRSISATGELGAAGAWKSSGEVSAPTSQTLYFVSATTGVCGPQPTNASLIRLEPVPAPPDVTGPLVAG